MEERAVGPTDGTDSKCVWNCVRQIPVLDSEARGNPRSRARSASDLFPNDTPSSATAPSPPYRSNKISSASTESQHTSTPLTLMMNCPDERSSGLGSATTDVDDTSLARKVRAAESAVRRRKTARAVATLRHWDSLCD